MKRLRLGRHHDDLVYVQNGDEPSNDDRRLGVFSTDRDAAMVVQWGNFFAGSLELSEYEEANPTAFNEAREFWAAELTRLDEAIRRTRGTRWRSTEAGLRVRRRHLALLLSKLGVDVTEEPEKRTEEGRPS